MLDMGGLYERSRIAAAVLKDAIDERQPRVALVLGSEGRGISRQVRATSDLVISIPISGDVESLNVATAGSIALFELARRMHGMRSKQVDQPLN